MNNKQLLQIIILGDELYNKIRNIPANQKRYIAHKATDFLDFQRKYCSPEEKLDEIAFVLGCIDDQCSNEVLKTAIYLKSTKYDNVILLDKSKNGSMRELLRKIDTTHDKLFYLSECLKDRIDIKFDVTGPVLNCLLNMLADSTNIKQQLWFAKNRLQVLTNASAGTKLKSEMLASFLASADKLSVSAKQYVRQIVDGSYITDKKGLEIMDNLENSITDMAGLIVINKIVNERHEKRTSLIEAIHESIKSVSRKLGIRIRLDTNFPDFHYNIPPIAVIICLEYVFHQLFKHFKQTKKLNKDIKIDAQKTVDKTLVIITADEEFCDLYNSIDHTINHIFVSACKTHKISIRTLCDDKIEIEF